MSFLRIRRSTSFGDPPTRSSSAMPPTPIRHRGSTGGVLTALGQFLIESFRVKFVLHVAASREHPMRSERKLSFDAAQVLEGAGSRYGPAAALIDFNDVLSRGEPFALVAKPCDVTAVNNLARHDPRVRELVLYRLALVCGGTSDLTKSRGAPCPIWYCRRSAALVPLSRLRQSGSHSNRDNGWLFPRSDLSRIVGGRDDLDDTAAMQNLSRCDR